MLGDLEAAALLSRHRMAAYKNETVFLRQRFQLGADGSFDPGGIGDDAPWTDTIMILLYKFTAA